MPEPLVGLGPIYTLDGVTPKVAPDAFIAPGAAVIGDVEIGSETGIWFHCLVRGDLNIIRIGARTNIQDGAIIHVDSGGLATYIGDDVTVGHNAVIHACTLKNRAFVGISATVLDGAVIGRRALVAAGATVPPGLTIPDGMLAAGVPARIVGELTAGATQWVEHNPATYRALARRHAAGAQLVPGTAG